jgi:acetolactate synthase-1/2/3 large subunit
LRRLPTIDQPVWDAWTASARAEHEEFGRVPPALDGESFGASRMMECVERRLPPEAIITNGAGNFAIWVHRFHRYRRFRSQLAPTSGAMGYGLPAAVAAKLRHPDRPVICFTGDGDFMMYPQELITARRYDLPIVVVILNNGMYGTIRMHQEARYPGRASGTDLLNPDFAALARSFGLVGETVATKAAFVAAFDRALGAAAATVIEVQVDPAQLTPDRRLDRR